MLSTLRQKAAAMLGNVTTRCRQTFKNTLARLRPRVSPVSQAPGIEPSADFVVSEQFGTARALSGRLRLLPWLPPKRDYVLLGTSQTPTSAQRLLVLLHGCKQNPEDFSRSTRIRELVARGDWLVMLPRQSKWANLYRCWNWFDASALTAGGEVAIVLAALEQVRRETGIEPNKTFIAGMSSGAALAASITCHAPDQFAGAAFHAGLAMGAAASASRARRVMSTEPDRDVTFALPRTAHLPAMVIQGADDDVVAPSHGDELTRQMLTLNRLIEPGMPLPESQPYALPVNHAGQLPATVRSFGENRLISILGLGHAWSGGDERWPFNDARGPDATTLMIDFFEQINA